jgi:hypothetical protein
MRERESGKGGTRVIQTATTVQRPTLAAKSATPSAGIFCNGYSTGSKDIMTDRTIPAGAKTLLCVYLLNNDSETRTTFISKHKAMKLLGITSENTFYSYRNWLESNGFITICGKITTVCESPDWYGKLLEKLDESKQNRKLKRKYKRICENGIFSHGDKCNNKIPRAVFNDTRLTMIAKLIYAYHCAFAGKNDVIKGENGRITFPKRGNILCHLGIHRRTYYKHYRLLAKFGYITPYKPRNNRLDNRTYYLLHDRPNPANASTDPQSGRILIRYIGEAKPKRFNVVNIVPEVFAKADKIDVIERAAVSELREHRPSLERLFEHDQHEYFAILRQSGGEMTRAGGIPYEYAADRTVATVAVHHLTDFADYVNNLQSGDFETQAFITFAEALTDLICTDELRTTKFKIPYAKVIDRLNSRFIRTDRRLTYLDRALVDEILENYVQYIYRTDNEIRHPLNYMKSCIWNAMISGKAAMRG